MKRLGFTTIALSVLLFSGCGNNKSNKKSKNIDKNISEKIEERDLIRIAHNYPDEACNSQLKSELSSKGIKDIIISIEDNNVSCETYSRINNNDGNCSESIHNSIHPNACVVGMNDPDGVLFDTETNTSTAPDTLLEIL
ncbi:MAG TPA: hypothetical protein EYH42_10145 [Sulfurovum sp.]|nr:hypothetical protein [Sulfurovum sp.]